MLCFHFWLCPDIFLIAVWCLFSPTCCLRTCLISTCFWSFFFLIGEDILYDFSILKIWLLFMALYAVSFGEHFIYICEECVFCCCWVGGRFFFFLVFTYILLAVPLYIFGVDLCFLLASIFFSLKKLFLTIYWILSPFYLRNFCTFIYWGYFRLIQNFYLIVFFLAL